MRNFDNLSERDILALAISLEEEDERIYADFDYPSELESFVRYMPVTDKYNPKAHSATENHARLMSKWKAFLEDRRRRFSR